MAIVGGWEEDKTAGIPIADNHAPWEGPQGTHVMIAHAAAYVPAANWAHG